LFLFSLSAFDQHTSGATARASRGEGSGGALGSSAGGLSDAMGDGFGSAIKLEHLAVSRRYAFVVLKANLRGGVSGTTSTAVNVLNGVAGRILKVGSGTLDLQRARRSRVGNTLRLGDGAGRGAGPNKKKEKEKNFSLHNSSKKVKLRGDQNLPRSTAAVRRGESLLLGS
jgi:hypothetical protein